MTEKIVKEGVELAEKELREKQVQEVKQIVLKTLERIKEQEKIRDEAIDKIKILKMDIDDLKDGKIDRIVERQEKDSKAKQVSVVMIIKEEIHHHYNPWYVPYRIIWQEPVLPLVPLIQNAVYMGHSGMNEITSYTSCNHPSINCSVAKDATVGVYELSNSEIVHLR